MSDSESYFKNWSSGIITKIRTNKTIPIFIISKTFEVLIKISLILLLPLIYGFVTTAYVQTFLCMVFMISVLLVGGSDVWLLKQMTRLDLTQKAAFNYMHSSIYLTLKISILLFLIIFTIRLIPINNLPINVIKENWLNVFISSASFSMITILSWSFRGLGRIILSQLFLGLYWSLVLISIIFFDYFFKDLTLSTHGITNLFTLFLFLPVPFYYLLFNRYIKKNVSKENKFDLNLKSLSIKNSRLQFFLEQSSGTGMTWLPIFFAGLFLADAEVGVFSTNYRIAFGIFSSLIIVNFLSAKKFSELFQKSLLNDLAKDYKFFSIFQSILGLLMFFFAIIIMFYLQSSSLYLINIYAICFLILITLSTFCGPADMLLNMCNQERINKNITIYILFALIILFSLNIKYHSLNSGYISIGIVMLLKQLISLYYAKKRILKV